MMEFRPRACPVCSSRDDSVVFAESTFDASRLNAYSFASRKVPELMHYRLVNCPGCSVLYASPAPDRDALAGLYREAEYDSAEESLHAARTYHRYLSRFLDRLPDRDGALDIGAGDGAFLSMLLGSGFSNLVGVEPSKAPVAAAKPEVRSLIRQTLFAGGDFAESSFSLVTCFQTLEHLDDPLDVCAASYRLLKRGGAFFAVAHNHRSASAKVLGTRSPIFDIEHLQLFSPASLERLLGRAGYSDIKVFPIANRYPLHYWLKIMPFPAKLKAGVIRLAKAAGIGYTPFSLRAGNMAAIGFKTID